MDSLQLPEQIELLADTADTIMYLRRRIGAFGSCPDIAADNEHVERVDLRMDSLLYALDTQLDGLRETLAKVELAHYQACRPDRRWAMSLRSGLRSALIAENARLWAKALADALVWVTLGIGARSARTVADDADPITRRFQLCDLSPV